MNGKKREGSCGADPNAVVRIVKDEVIRVFRKETGCSNERYGVCGQGGVEIAVC